MHMANDLKVPRRKGAAWLLTALSTTPRDGQWHRIKTMGVSSAEQTARANNPSTPSAGWEYAYRITGPETSELWVRWV